MSVEFGNANVPIEILGTIVFDLSIKPDALDVWVRLSLHFAIESMEYAHATGILLDLAGLDHWMIPPYSLNTSLLYIMVPRPFFMG